MEAFCHQRGREREGKREQGRGVGKEGTRERERERERGRMRVRVKEKGRLFKWHQSTQRAHVRLTQERLHLHCQKEQLLAGYLHRKT